MGDAKEIDNRRSTPPDIKQMFTPEQVRRFVRIGDLDSVEHKHGICFSSDQQFRLNNVRTRVEGGLISNDGQSMRIGQT